MIGLILATATAVVAANHAARGHADDVWLLPMTIGFIVLGLGVVWRGRR